jgi:hypothetical protein
MVYVIVKALQSFNNSMEEKIWSFSKSTLPQVSLSFRVLLRQGSNPEIGCREKEYV